MILMGFILVVGIPTLIIVVSAVYLNLKHIFPYVYIFVLGYLSTFIVDFTYCHLLNFECKPDPLNALGQIIHSVLVIFFSLVAYAIWKRKAKKVSSKESKQQC